MKKILFITTLLLMPLGMLFAQANKSSIRFRLSDGDLMKLAINERYFDKTGRSLTVGDIPGKNQMIKIYRYKPYGNRTGGKATLLFSGKIKIEKGNQYDAVVDVKTGQLSITKVNHLTSGEATMPDPHKNEALPNQQPQRSNAGEYVPDEALFNPAEDPTQTGEAARLSAPMAALHKSMEAQVSDAKKLEEAQKYLKKNKLTSKEAQLISSWLLFDDNRLSFLKQAYDKISDVQNIGVVHSTFSEDDTRESFEKFLNDKSK